MHDSVAEAHAFADAAGIDHATRSRLAIVVEELVTNLYDHGELAPDEVFELELSVTADEVRLALRAPGKRFDPTSSIVQGPSQAAGAGAGLKLVKAWSTHLEHDYADGRNRLVVMLPIGGR
ncbi:ATP-binding protein [Sphingomonas sp. URHD0057]|uniref:ATP-binding protein n=1 Tax=Sphingomonas sp. URHD0057 TaxID=1380389 RepID=UPI00048BE5F2|nr:ATP-binding protein [Sphingomonas sp. URHD0057]